MVIRVPMNAVDAIINHRSAPVSFFFVLPLRSTWHHEYAPQKRSCVVGPSVVVLAGLLVKMTASFWRYIRVPLLRVNLCRHWRHQIDAVGGLEYDSSYALSLYLKHVVCTTSMR